MELMQEKGAGYFIKQYESGQFFTINEERFCSSVIVQPFQPPQRWDIPSLESLMSTDMQFIAQFSADIYLIGVGGSFQLLPLELLLPLYNRQKGVEVMDTAAACRTYNILMAEERRVVAALIL